MQLTNKQEQALRTAVQRYHDGEMYTVISGYAGSGKAQPNDTIIPTPSGDRILGELKIGDYIFDHNGNPTKVIGVFPQGEKDVWEVTLKDDRTTKCCPEHLWSYYSQNGNLLTNTTKFLKDRGLFRCVGNNGYKTFIPRNKPVQYTEKQFQIDPYVIGSFLGDGYCVSDVLAFSSQDEEIVINLQNKLNAKNIVRKNINEYTWFFETNNPNRFNQKYIQTKEIFDIYKEEIMQYSQNKKIPKEYLEGSVEQRFELLRGLMDTDGTINDDGKYFSLRFTSVSKDLITDVQQLLFSLGYWSTITIDQRQEKYTTNECYTLNITAPNADKELFFNLQRKKDIAHKAKNYTTRTRYDWVPIVNIENLNYQTEMTCIEVDNPQHLYLTNDYIVTHNTTIIKYIIAALQLDPQENVCFCCYTGKAASVLKSKGCANAMTAHKLLYQAKPLPDGSFMFIPRKSFEHPYSVIVIDEVSMLPRPMWDLLLSHGVYVLACGDPGQLPPVNPEDDNHVLDHPHIFLDEVLRQAQDSEIIRLSMWVREGKPLLSFPCQNEEVQIFRPGDVTMGMYTWADQVLVATNATRNSVNTLMRQAKGFGEEPEVGDKIISLSNHWKFFSKDGEWPLTNGVIGTITDYKKQTKYLPRYISEQPLEYMYTDINFEDGEYSAVPVDYGCLMTGEPSVTPRQRIQIKNNKRLTFEAPYDFAYAYAVTAHKAQGSQWGRVMVLEERFPFAVEEHKKWLYTAVTRPSEKLVLVTKN